MLRFIFVVSIAPYSRAYATIMNIAGCRFVVRSQSWWHYEWSIKKKIWEGGRFVFCNDLAFGSHCMAPAADSEQSHVLDDFVTRRWSVLMIPPRDEDKIPRLHSSMGPTVWPCSTRPPPLSPTQINPLSAQLCQRHHRPIPFWGRANFIITRIRWRLRPQGGWLPWRGEF